MDLPISKKPLRSVTEAFDAFSRVLSTECDSDSSESRLRSEESQTLQSDSIDNELRRNAKDQNDALERIKPYVRFSIYYMYLEVAPEGLDRGPYCKFCWSKSKSMYSLSSFDRTQFRCSECRAEVTIREDDDPLGIYSSRAKPRSALERKTKKKWHPLDKDNPH